MKFGAENGFFSFVLPTLPGFLSRPMVDSGLLILSRLPIVDSDEHYFSRYFDVDAMSSKGVVFAKIEVQSNFLYLFNTHTQANYIESNFERYKGSVNQKLS